MKKTIAIRTNFEREFKIRTSQPYDFSSLIPDYLPKSEKIRLVKFFFKAEQHELIESLLSRHKRLEEVRLKYNNLLKSTLSYLRDLILLDTSNGIFITITGSLTKDLATFDSDIDMDIFSQKKSRKKAIKLFSEFSSAVRETTGHKIDPIFKSIATFDLFHLFYPKIPPSSWIIRLGLIGQKLLWILKQCCDLLYSLIHSFPTKNTFIGTICSSLHNKITGLLSTVDIDFYREYFAMLAPYGFHPSRSTISPHFFWGDKQSFLSLFPNIHLISKETSPLYKLALSIPVSTTALDLYLRMLFRKPLKSVFKLFPLIPLLGYLLGIKTMDYNDLVNRLRSNSIVIRYLGTDFIDSFDFYNKFKFALSVFRDLRKTYGKKYSLSKLAGMMNCTSIDELIDTAKMHLQNYNLALVNLRRYYHAFF